MSDLLQVRAIKLGSRKGQPLLMEFPVPADSWPYLVTSSAAVAWVEQPFPGAVVRAAVRSPKPSQGALFLELANAVAERGHESQWGNVHDLSLAGLNAAIAHLKSYGMVQIEILAFPEWPGFPGMPTVPVVFQTWLPVGLVLVVPIDKSYLGFVGLLDRDGLVAVVHNPSRAMGVLLAAKLAVPNV